jgi:hypothetical protein
MTSKLLFPVLVAGLLLAGCGVPTTPTQGPAAPAATTSGAQFHVQGYYGYDNYKPYYPPTYKPYYPPTYKPYYPPVYKPYYPPYPPKKYY